MLFSRNGVQKRNNLLKDYFFLNSDLEQNRKIGFFSPPLLFFLEEMKGFGWVLLLLGAITGPPQTWARQPVAKVGLAKAALRLFFVWRGLTLVVYTTDLLETCTYHAPPPPHQTDMCTTRKKGASQMSTHNTTNPYSSSYSP